MPRSYKQTYGEATGELQVWVMGEDFPIPPDTNPIGEVGVAISGDLCTVYGDLGNYKIRDDITIDLPDAVAPMFAVCQILAVVPAGESTGHPAILRVEKGPSGSYMHIALNDGTKIPAGGTLLRFGQANYLRA